MVLRVINSLFPPKKSAQSLLSEASLSLASSKDNNLSIISPTTSQTILPTTTPILLKEYDTIAGNESKSDKNSPTVIEKRKLEPCPEKLDSLLWKLSIDDNSYMDPPPITLEYNYRIKMYEMASKAKQQPVSQNVEDFNILEIIKYSSAFGEAFATILRADVRRSSYALGTGFVCCDIYQQCKNNKNNIREPIKFADEFLRQMFSYVIVPAFVVKHVALFTNRGLRSIYGCPNTCNKVRRTVYRNARLFLPIIAGLISIPIIIHPIEQFIDYCMDHTYRVVLK